MRRRFLWIWSLALWLAAGMAGEKSWAVRPIAHYHDLVAGMGDKGYRDGFFSEALFNFPSGLALDNENRLLYVADSGNNRIRVVDLSKENQVSTLAGNEKPGKIDGPLENASFNGPMALAYLPDGRLAVNDSGNNLIRLIDLKKRTVETLAGNGTDSGPQEGKALEVTVSALSGLAYSPTEDAIYFSNSHQLFRLDLKARMVKKMWEGQPPLPRPGALCMLKDRLYVADQISPAVFEAEPSGNTLPGQALLSFHPAGNGENSIVALAPCGEDLYALQRGPVPLAKVTPYRPVSMATVWGGFLDNTQQNRPKFLNFDQVLPALLPDPLQKGRFFVTWPNAHSVLSVKDYSFDQYKDGLTVNENGLSDFDYPLQKPPHTYRILIVGDSKTFITSMSEREKSGGAPKRMDNLAKRLELMLNTEGAMDEVPVDFEVFNASRLADDPTALCIWSYYLVPQLVQKFDIDLVIYVAAVQTIPGLCNPWFQRPMTPEGIPKWDFDAEFLLKPLAEKIPPGIPEQFYKRCLEKKLCSVNGNRLEFAGQDSILMDGVLKGEAEQMVGKPVGMLSEKIRKMKTSGGQAIPFWVFYVPVGDHNETPLDLYSSFWQDICAAKGIPFLDLTRPFLALKPTYSPINENGYGDHLTGDGYILFAYIMAHELIGQKIIPFKN